MNASLERLHSAYFLILKGQPSLTLESHPGNDLARWNARQIIEHLVLSYRSSSALFRTRLEKDRPTVAQPSFQQRVVQYAVCDFGLIPSGRTAPQEVLPAEIASEALDGDSIAAWFQDELQTLDALLWDCEKRFGEKRFATHQFIGPLSVCQWRQFHVAHGRHHLKQMRRLFGD